LIFIFHTCWVAKYSSSPTKQTARGYVKLVTISSFTGLLIDISALDITPECFVINISSPLMAIPMG